MSIRFAGPLRRVGGYAAAMSALTAVFMLYLQPDFMVGLAQQLWACF